MCGYSSTNKNDLKLHYKAVSHVIVSLPKNTHTMTLSITLLAFKTNLDIYILSIHFFK